MEGSCFDFSSARDPGQQGPSGLRAGTDVIVKIDGECYMQAGGVGWWTENICMQTRGLHDDRDKGIPPEFIVDIYWRPSGASVWPLPTPTIDHDSRPEQGELLAEVILPREEARTVLGRVTYSLTKLQMTWKG